MKHTTTLRNSLAKWFSLAAIISLFAFSPMESSAQFACGAGFQYSVSGMTVQFLDSSYSQFGYICQWTLGNGTSSTQYNPFATYNASGYYGVCLTITDTINGCTNTHCDSIFVGAANGCQSSFYVVSNSAGNVNFNASASTFTTAPVTYAWDFNDGNTATSTQDTISHFYSITGYYAVCLTITDATGCTSTWCYTIYAGVTGGGCQASFTSQSNGGNTVYFNNTSTPATSYFWDFGDNSTSTQMVPSHNYASTGSYIVCLTIIDSSFAGYCTNTFCDSVIVISGGGSCSASYTMTTSGTTASFTNTSTGNFNTSLWSFDDGTSSSQTNPTHTFASNGVYIVCLTVSDSNGTCQDQSCQTVTVGNSVFTYSISGMISTNNTPIDYAKVFLIQYDSASQSLNLIDTFDVTPFDSSYYYFTNLPAGSYLVKAAAGTSSANYATTVPTYYINSLFWSVASSVVLGPSQYSVNINMVQGVNPGGPGFIGGLVSQGANKVEAAGDPLSGIQVMLLDMSNTAVANTYSDANGNYSFANIAYGTYKVYAEILNKPTNPAIVTIDAANPSVTDVPVIVNTNEVTTVTPYINITNIESALLYPNPAKEGATLKLDLTKAGDYTIQITDMIGRLVSTVTTSMIQGENNVKLPLQNIESGIYMIRVSDSISNFNMKLTVVK